MKRGEKFFSPFGPDFIAKTEEGRCTCSSSLLFSEILLLKSHQTRFISRPSANQRFPVILPCRDARLAINECGNLLRVQALPHSGLMLGSLYGETLHLLPAATPTTTTEVKCGMKPPFVHGQGQNGWKNSARLSLSKPNEI